MNAFPEGITLDGAGDNLELMAERTSDSGSENISLLQGTHRILLTVKTKLGMVHYNTMGGVPVAESQAVAMGKLVPKPEEVTKEGHTFDGWFDNSQQKLWDFDQDRMYSDTLTLDAEWTTIRYVVAFDPNAEGDDSVAAMPIDQEIDFAKTIEEPNPSPTRANFIFDYWALDPAGSQPWDFENGTMPSSDITLYAIWEADVYTVTYHALGGTPDIQEEMVKPGEQIPQAITEPLWERHKFLGWFEDRDTTIPWNQETLMPSQNVELFAKWEKVSATVTFEIGGGEPASKPADISFLPGDTLDLTAFQPSGEQIPTYQGHFFQGWLDESGTVVPKTVTLEEKDHVFTAQWLAIDPVDLPNQFVAYRQTKDRIMVEEEIDTTIQLVDLFDQIHTYRTRFLWDDAVLDQGGIEKIQVSLVDENKATSISLAEPLVIYILNKGDITSQESQTFLFGQNITLSGDEWGASCLVESPDFATQTIKSSPAALVFYLKGTNTREPGTYYPEFIGTYADYFGEPVHVSRIVTAIVLPFDPGGGVIPQQDYWKLVREKMANGAQGTHLFVSAENYPIGGQEILLPLEGYDKRIHARPEEFTLMPAGVLQAVKEQTKAQLQVDLDWIQWYFNSSDFQGESGNPQGSYPLEVTQGSQHELIHLEQGQNLMTLHFAMNKAWEARPTLQVSVTEALRDSAAEGKKSLSLLEQSPAPTP